MVIMVISFKDSLKLFGISIMMCCAITVCNMFMNYLIDLKGVESPMLIQVLCAALVLEAVYL